MKVGFQPGNESSPILIWVQGRSKEISGNTYFAIPLYGGNVPRRPKEYTKLENGKESQTPLNQSNETIHPAVRYRRFCKNQKKLGTDDAQPFDPVSLKGWIPPSAQKDGRVGEGCPVTTKGTLAWTKTIDNETKTMEESPMGKYEKMLLALYDQDAELRKRDGSIWTKVLGGDG